MCQERMEERSTMKLGRKPVKDPKLWDARPSTPPQPKAPCQQVLWDHSPPMASSTRPETRRRPAIRMSLTGGKGKGIHAQSVALQTKQTRPTSQRVSQNLCPDYFRVLGAPIKLWPLKKMYISCTEPSCHNWLPDFQLVRRNSFTTAYPMNCQHKLVWQLGSVHKIHIHLEATSPSDESRSQWKCMRGGGW